MKQHRTLEARRERRGRRVEPDVARGPYPGSLRTSSEERCTWSSKPRSRQEPFRHSLQDPVDRSETLKPSSSNGPTVYLRSCTSNARLTREPSGARLAFASRVTRRLAGSAGSYAAAPESARRDKRQARSVPPVLLAWDQYEIRGAALKRWWRVRPGREAERLSSRPPYQNAHPSKSPPATSELDVFLQCSLRVCITMVSGAGWAGATRAQARGLTAQIRQLQTIVSHHGYLPS